MNYETRKRIRGFSLIELLVVISILGLLSVITVSQFNTAKKKGRDVQRKGDLSSLSKALQMYFADYGQFPDKATIQPLLVDPDGNGEFVDRGYTYMKKVPIENYTKLGLPGYCYTVTADGKKFALFSGLENDQDPEYQKYSSGGPYRDPGDCSGNFDYVIFSANASGADFP